MQTIENFQLNQSSFISNSNMSDQTHIDFQRISFKRKKFYQKALKAFKKSFKSAKGLKIISNLKIQDIKHFSHSYK